jgi:hypothetical protein
MHNSNHCSSAKTRCTPQIIVPQQKHDAQLKLLFLSNNTMHTSNHSLIVKHIFIYNFSIFLICRVLLMHNRFSLTEWNDEGFHNIWTGTDSNITLRQDRTVRVIAQWDAFMQTLLQWKTISFTYSECVYSLRYPACNAHASYWNLWPVPSTISYLPHYLTNGTTVNGKKKSPSIQYMALLSLQLCQQHLSF